jgi:hypothetical protein
MQKKKWIIYLPVLIILFSFIKVYYLEGGEIPDNRLFSSLLFFSLLVILFYYSRNKKNRIK